MEKFEVNVKVGVSVNEAERAAVLLVKQMRMIGCSSSMYLTLKQLHSSAIVELKHTQLRKCVLCEQFSSIDDKVVHLPNCVFVEVEKDLHYIEEGYK